MALTIAVIGVPLPGAEAKAPNSCRDVAGIPTNASPSDCKTAQPGAGITVDGNNALCTISFLFRGSDRHTYAGTAGHCSLYARLGAKARSQDRTALGVLVYADYDIGPPNRDFLLIRLFPSARVNPSVEVFGGPRGTLRGSTAEPFRVRHIGRGIGLSQVKDAREGVIGAMARPDMALMTAAAGPNDSGSPVMTFDGLAVGWVIGTSSMDPAEIHPRGGAAAGWQVIRVDPAMQRAARQLKITLTLMHGAPAKAPTAPRSA